MTQRIIYVGLDMLGRVNPGIVNVESEESEEYIYDFAERGHHYFYYEGDLSWLDEFSKARLEALEEWKEQLRTRPPGLLCGSHPPENGDVFWDPQGNKHMWLAGEWRPVAPEPSAPPTWQEKLVAKVFCPACFLPRFIPGHKFRGCWS